MTDPIDVIRRAERARLEYADREAARNACADCAEKAERIAQLEAAMAEVTKHPLWRIALALEVGAERAQWLALCESRCICGPGIDGMVLAKGTCVVCQIAASIRETP